jgi:Lactonase, 7-bladed beta-propeller
VRNHSIPTVLSLATMLAFAGCGGSTHPHPCSTTSIACVPQRFVYATTAANKVLAFPVTQTGTLGSPTSIPVPAIAGSIAVSQSSGELFFANHVNGTVSAFVTGTSTLYSSAPGSPYPASGIGSLGAVVTTPDGRYVYVAGAGGGVHGFSIASDGSLVQVPGSPFAVVANSVDVVVDSAGKLLFVISGASVSVFAINASDGSLTPAASPVALPALTLPTPGMAATVSATGSFLFVALGTSNSVAAFDIDTNTGALTPVAGSPFATGNAPFDVTATSTAVYVANNLDGTISAFTWDKNTGVLTTINGSPFNAPWGGGLTSLGGQYLYVTSVNNAFPPFVNSILGYSIGSSGAISPLPGSPFSPGVQLSGGHYCPVKIRTKSVG